MPHGTWRCCGTWRWADLPDFFSLRLRAETSGMHVSGAERLVPETEAAPVVAALLERSLARRAQRLVLTAERVDEGAIMEAPLLPVTTLELPGPLAIPCVGGGQGHGTRAGAAPDPEAGRRAAAGLLAAAGVVPTVAARALNWLAAGPGPGGRVMRGAVLADAETGERLEPDRARGVRVSRFDYHPAVRDAVGQALRKAGLAHFRVGEALAVASKVAAAPGAVAELCWSDDPAYTWGYVAAPVLGYVRLPLKSDGDPKGGRVFFLRRGQGRAAAPAPVPAPAPAPASAPAPVPAGDFSLDDYIRFLAAKPVLLRGPLSITTCREEDFYAGHALRMGRAR